MENYYKDIVELEEAIEILVRVMKRHESFSAPEQMKIVQPILNALDLLADTVDILEDYEEK
jgi:hypothetical protein